MMKTKCIVSIAVFVFVFSTTLGAEDMVKRFTFTTIKGETIDSSTLKGMPVVICFISHW